MPVRLRERAARQIAITLPQARLAGHQRLLDAVDQDHLGGAGIVERIARPQYDVAMTAGRETAEIAAEPNRFGGVYSKRINSFVSENRTRHESHSNGSVTRFIRGGTPFPR